MCTSSASFEPPTIFLRYSTEYLDLTFALPATFMLTSSLAFISIFALDKSPSATMLSFCDSASKDRLSATISTSSTASFNKLAGAFITALNFKSGIFCSFSSSSIIGNENVLVVLLLNCNTSLFSSSSKESISSGFALLNICFRLFRLIASSTLSLTSYSVKQLLNSLNMTMATFAGSIATSSIAFGVILKVASLTSSEIMLTESFKYFGSANVNLIVYPTSMKLTYLYLKFFLNL